jgi:hypothetical protein
MSFYSPFNGDIMSSYINGASNYDHDGIIGEALDIEHDT